MQQLLNICDTYAKEYDLLYNGGKSYSLCFKPKCSIFNKPVFTLNHLNIATVNQSNIFYLIGIDAQDTETPQGNSHYSDYLSNKPNCNLQFHPITNCDVTEIIGNLKPKISTGIDNISSKLLRQTKDSITETLTIIVNQMLKTGTKFPELLKTSKVIPLYKKGDNSNLSNYRPIALLPSNSKIFEKAILTQLTKYLENNSIIHPHQYGFRKFHSTEYAALQLTDYINGGSNYDSLIVRTVAFPVQVAYWI